MAKKSTVLFWGMVVFLFVGLTQVHGELRRYRGAPMESLLYIPSGKYLQPLALGYDQLLADLLWMKTLSYFGGQYMTDKEYPWLFHILNLIIDLDPRFGFPYYFGGTVLSLEANQVDRANKILERGMEAYPEKWNYPFIIGFNYFYHEKDAAKAAPYIEKASVLPNAPAFLKTMVGNLYAKAGKKQIAVNFYREAYRNTNDELIRQRIRERIDEILAEEEGHDSGNSDKTSQ